MTPEKEKELLDAWHKQKEEFLKIQNLLKETFIRDLAVRDFMFAALCKDMGLDPVQLLKEAQAAVDSEFPKILQKSADLLDAQQKINQIFNEEGSGEAKGENLE